MGIVSQVTDTVYCIQRRDYLSCSYFVTTETGVVLIDAGIDVLANDVKNALEEVGRSITEVQALLLTHWHNDHSSGAASVRESSDCRVYFHESGREKFSREDRATGLRGWFADQLPGAGLLSPLKGLLELAPPRAVEATGHLQDGQVIENSFRVIETPGHEAGHLSFFYEPEGVLFAGDAFAVAKDHLAFMSRFLTEDKAKAKESMLRCLDLPLKAICPGHRYPLVNPSQQELDRFRKKVEAMRWWPIIGC